MTWGEEESGTSLLKDKKLLEGIKSSESRLARTFQKSREQWKERAAAKQKKLRAMEVKVRDLSASRDHWKQRAMLAEKQLPQLLKELEALKKKGNLRG